MPLLKRYMKLVLRFIFLLHFLSSIPISLESVSGNYTVSSMMFDVNGHFVFTSLDRFEFYGLAGLDILCYHKTINTPLKICQCLKELIMHSGLNIGAGSYMKITEIFMLATFMVKVKYIFSHYDQFMVNAGILINH